MSDLYKVNELYSKNADSPATKIPSAFKFTIRESILASAVPDWFCNFGQTGIEMRDDSMHAATLSTLSQVAGLKSQAGKEPNSSALEQKKKVLGNYLVGKTIGEGAFAKVKQATHRFHRIC